LVTLGLLAAVRGYTRQEKLDGVWGKISSTRYFSLPSFKGKDVTNPLNLIKFGFENMDDSFDLPQDIMPDGHTKLIHPLGATARAEFRPSAGSGYTGLFASGADSCLVRVSLAVGPGTSNFVPGMAFKCFIDGNAPSANMIAMYSLDGQGNDFNVFSNSFTNIVDTPNGIALKFLAKSIFARAAHCPTWISNAQFSRTDQTGATTSPNWPVKLEYRPSDAAKASGSGVKAGDEFRSQLAKIPASTKLWDVFAVDQNSGSKTQVGEIWTTSSFIPADYQDVTLFFQHERGEVDGCPASA
jgi:hypothetical protein